MTDTLVPPRERECELCGRRDVWDETTENWHVAGPGVVHCIHEWDINGNYDPFRTDE